MKVVDALTSCSYNLEQTEATKS